MNSFMRHKAISSHLLLVHKNLVFFAGLAESFHHNKESQAYWSSNIQLSKVQTL